ncbi:unnamed protein product [Coregonus sp. 'balchen']|nr:unnamed protein product [Coregonus sp. 'balchen']
MEENNVRKSKGRRRQLLADHSYTGEKPPPDSSGEEIEESGLSVNIIDAVTAKINERVDGLEKMIRENTSKIVDLETSLNHAYESIEELKRYMAVDIAHRIGKKQDAIGSRSIIIQFAFHTARDAVWKKAKESAFLKEREFRFGEDLTAADKAAKAKLWPLVQQA